MSIALRYAARSDVGLVRSDNQDSAYAGPDLLVVADGMGGHAGGDVASSIAVGELSALDGGDGGADATDHLRTRITAAHTALVRRVAQDPELAGMGTTVTALLRAGDRLALAHVGDSRGYRLRGGDLTQVTHDHTFVQGLVDAGRITPEEAERHPQRSVIMKVLGDSDTDTDPDLSWHEARLGDRWLLCSDGLSGVVATDTIGATLRDLEDVDACADALVELALGGGAPDNVTVVVADVVDVDPVAPVPAQVVGAAGGRGRTGEVAAGAAPPAGPAAPPDGSDTRADTDGARQDSGDDDGDEDGRGRGGRWWRVVGVLGVLVLLVAGGAGAWAWGRQQFFVGADGGDVAIFRGLQQDLGPVVLSSVYEQQGLSTQDLPDYWQQQVEDRIGADDLAEARQVVSQLRLRSVECRQAAAQAAEPRPDPTAGATTGPGASGTAPTVAPSPAPQVPPGCEGVGG